MTVRERCRTKSFRLRLHNAACVAGRDACAKDETARRVLNAAYRAAYRSHVASLLLEPTKK
ncbi:hypothetical protein GCM10009539_60840 [Cryptosporangium japonicum]|uniref:Uncharacterized protein n=1 Tax=Cryptosporangium japonicum TaxID=80872 RepID=A0ABN0UY72_9ACTN